jgi:hypothetical protein
MKTALSVPDEIFEQAAELVISRSEFFARGARRQLEKDILAWVDTWNDDPKPFISVKTAEEILESLGRLLRRIKARDTRSLTGYSLSCCGTVLR